MQKLLNVVLNLKNIAITYSGTHQLLQPLLLLYSEFIVSLNPNRVSQKQFIQLKTSKYIALNLVAMVVVAFVLLFVILEGLDIYTRHGEAVVVPDVKNLTLSEGVKRLGKDGLEGIVFDSTYVKDKPAGIILDLNPTAGHKVKKGRTIYITVNTSAIPMMTPPDVADNSSVRQARALILATGFRLTENELVPGERDWVYGLKYNGRELKPGDKVPTGATLTLIVGSGDREEAADSLDVEVVEFEETKQSTTDNDSWF